MKEEIKARWLAALRSGKYKQGRGRLARKSDAGEDQFCCLGVLCELAVEDGVIDRIQGEEVESIRYGKKDERWLQETSYPPAAVLSWAGLDSRNPVVGEGGLSLSHYNDGFAMARTDIRPRSFNEIADLIERDL